MANGVQREKEDTVFTRTAGLIVLPFWGHFKEDNAKILCVHLLLFILALNFSSNFNII